MSWMSEDDESNYEDPGDYVRAVTPGPVETQRPFSTPPILYANKQFPASEPSTSHHSFLSLTQPSTSSCYEPRVTKYPRSQSCVPFLSVNSTPDNLNVMNMRPFTQHLPTVSPLNTLPVVEQSIRNAANISEEILDTGTSNEAKMLSLTSKTKTSSKNLAYKTEAVQESNGYHVASRSVDKNKFHLDNTSPECLTSLAVVKNDKKVSFDSFKTEFSSVPLPADPDGGQSLGKTNMVDSVVSNMNDIKHKTQKLRSPKSARYDHTKYVDMRLKKVKVENKLWANESLIKEQTNNSRLDERENDPVQVEPLCPLEKKIKRPRSMIKRPMNQYMLFQRDTREKVRAEHPDESVTQITCRLGYLWRNLPLSEKAKWQARAKYVKEEHMRLHPEYQYNPQTASERRQEYITELTERRNLYRIKPQSDAEEV